MKFCYPIVLFSYILLANANFVEIEIPQGKLKGAVKKSFLERDFNSFTGIPYAKPPIGDLRFEPVVPLESWEGLLDATEYKSDCVQDNLFANNFNVFGDEDCLYINVFTPKLPSKSTDPLPVMFYTHGGGWMIGSGSDQWYGPEFFMDEDVVLVTYNYRLGALGFLSTGDEVVPGNNGLKDQSLALQWTKQNIMYFGGDPNKITIFGNSAGGGSTHYQMFSPLTRDLFHSAIIQSGVGFGPWALGSKEYMERNLKDFAKMLNCPTSSSKDTVACLKKINVKDLITTTIKLFKWAKYDPVVVFRPVIEANTDGAFLVEPLEVTAKLGKVAKVPIILSITWDDGFLRSGHIFNNRIEKEFNENYDELAQYVFLLNDKNQTEITEKIRKFYFKSKSIDDKNSIDALTNIITDSWFLYPLSKALHTHNKHSQQPVYTFLFNFRGKHSYGDYYGDARFKNVVCHSDELLYLFATKTFGIFHNTDFEIKVVKDLIKLWTNFGKYGEPTPTEDFPKWQPVSGEDFQFYYLDRKANFQMIDNPFLERLRFWKQIREDPVYKDEL